MLDDSVEPTAISRDTWDMYQEVLRRRQEWGGLLQSIFKEICKCMQEKYGGRDVLLPIPSTDADLSTNAF